MWRRSYSKAELRASIRARRRAAARARRLQRSRRIVFAALDPSEEGPIRPAPVERTGPVSPPIKGAGGRRYQVVDLGEGLFGVRVGGRVVSHHRSSTEANRCIELMEENR